MKLSVVACMVSLVLSARIARGGDDPMPAEEPTAPSEPATDEPGDPGENAPAPADPYAPAPAPAPAPKPAHPPRARLSSTPSARITVRPRLKDDGESRLDKVEDEVEGGRHWRVATAQGAVHVWVPDGYDRANAGTVVYVHGYWTDADGAWNNHQLAKQFRMSRQNALFIVPDAPSSREMGVQWPALTDLRRAVTRANIKLPDGPIVVMGHSGAFRTVMQWVDHKLVDQIILLDAMYAGEYAFDEFIKSGKRADEHKLIVVGADVAQNSAAFANKYKFAFAREKVPEKMAGFTKEERRAKLLYIRSQYDHYAIVTSKKVIPLLLKVTRLKAI
jgi:hypothetical protein